MPLNLHHSDSVAPYLEDMLRMVMGRHGALGLSPDFRIIAPDSMSTRDLEASLLQLSPSGLVLGGVQSLQDFMASLLGTENSQKPLASPFLECRALRLALSEWTGSGEIEAPALSLKSQLRHTRAFNQYLLWAQVQKPLQTAPIVEKYLHILNHRLGRFSQAQALAQPSQGLASKLKRLKALYFLGHHYPSPQLWLLVNALLSQLPDLQIHLFFPPTERLQENSGLMQQLLQKFYTLLPGRQNISEYPRLKAAEFLSVSQASAYHESQAAYQALLSSEKKPLVLAPAHSASARYLHAWLHPDATSSAATPSSLPWELTQQTCDALASKPHVNSALFFKTLKNAFQERQVQLARTKNLVALTYLRSNYEQLLELSLAEAQQPEEASLGFWQNMVNGLWQAEPLAWTDRSLMRPFPQAGLKRAPVVHALSLNSDLETDAGSSLIEDWNLESLAVARQRYDFECLAYLAQDHVVLSTLSYSLSGEKLKALKLWEEIKFKVQDKPEHFEAAERELLAAGNNFLATPQGQHPYFNENLAREQARQEQWLKPESMGEDMGNLTRLSLEGALLQKIQKRSLSASYLDQYRQCAWRFLASWHFKLKNQHAIPLELAAERRGLLLHRLLEKLYRQLQASHFSAQQVPALELCYAQLEDCARQLMEEFQKELAHEAGQRLPQSILNQEIEALSIKVKALVESEINDFSAAPAKLLPQYFEWSFGQKSAAPLWIELNSSERIPLSGIIDRIDLSEDGQHFLVIDYKSSSTDILSRKLRQKQSFQLWIYQQAVRELLLKNSESLGGLYWDLRETKKNQGMVEQLTYSGYTAQKLRGHSFFKSEDYASLDFELGQELKSTLAEIIRANYSIVPLDCGGPRCPYREICRYPAQPNY